MGKGRGILPGHEAGVEGQEEGTCESRKDLLVGRTERGIQYVLVDACCVNTSSSAELTEAINSMFRWYERATICYVWLFDLDASAHLDSDWKKRRWFTRGWTLQELIAPKSMGFYNRDWKFIGQKSDLPQ
ncbi:het domain-containing protein [Colletotrichum incanum]|uniref:Het domain-containing protein n=1 Tax=Colletotrichum incanum TaxID=1573173 RepID=A0A161W1B7_COLIC|nr:het domain-containing protein [Colletotrichum incanum]